MKPAEFAYEAPRSVAAIRSALAAGPKGARILAGGQGLVPLLNSRTARPTLLVDINRAADLGEIDRPGGDLRVGATVRMADAERSEDVREACPLLSQALPWVANPQVRNRATIVGNLVSANRGSELPAVALALEAVFTIEGPSGSPRRCPASVFFRTDGTVACSAGEFVSSVTFPRQAPGAGCAFLEAQRRSAHYALLGVAAALVIRGGRVAGARIAMAGASPFPVRCHSAEAMLAGEAATPGLLAAAAREAARTATSDAYDDLHATAHYRRAVAPELALRTLTAAARSAAR
jgi:carbon-monoxide dehydrogenase medium subunit